MTTHPLATPPATSCMTSLFSSTTSSAEYDSSFARMIDLWVGDALPNCSDSAWCANVCECFGRVSQLKRLGRWMSGWLAGGARRTRRGQVKEGSERVRKEGHEWVEVLMNEAVEEQVGWRAHDLMNEWITEYFGWWISLFSWMKRNFDEYWVRTLMNELAREWKKCILLYK